jgi:hypothetical protein
MEFIPTNPSRLKHSVYCEWIFRLSNREWLLIRVAAVQTSRCSWMSNEVRGQEIVIRLIDQITFLRRTQWTVHSKIIIEWLRNNWTVWSAVTATVATKWTTSYTHSSNIKKGETMKFRKDEPALRSYVLRQIEWKQLCSESRTHFHVTRNVHPVN